MSTINVLIAVDAATLALQVKDGSIKPGTQSTPTSLHSYIRSDVYIDMIMQNGSVSNASDGQPQFQMKCNSGDTVRWTITSFANNFDHSVFLYNVKLSRSFAKVSYDSTPLDNYLPTQGDGGSTGNVTKYVNQIATVQANVVKVGRSNKYMLSFQLIDNSNGEVIGYFKWVYKD